MLMMQNIKNPLKYQLLFFHNIEPNFAQICTKDHTNFTFYTYF